MFEQEKKEMKKLTEKQEKLLKFARLFTGIVFLFLGILYILKKNDFITGVILTISSLIWICLAFKNRK